MSTDGSPVDQSRSTVDATGARLAVVVARFHSDITERLLAGALEALREHGATDADVEVIRVPGAWELPQTAARAVERGRFDAIIALGCVVRGETPHFDFVCQEATLGLGAVARTSHIPVVFGVLTTDDVEQANARSRSGKDNKGYEVAIAALEMISVYRALGGQ